MHGRIALVLTGVMVVAGCATQSVGNVPPAASTTASVASVAPEPTEASPAATEVAEAPTLAPTPNVILVTPTPTPAGPATYKVGDAITVTESGSDWAKITITDVKIVGSYKGSYYTDKPQTRGNVFIQAKVTYEALQDGVDYNPFDWQVFCAGMAVNNTTFLMNAPKPELDSGKLPNGRKATGYVVYEVPGKGEVRMSYGGNIFSNSGPVFEVIIRAA